jgi:nucleoside-triphosphatase THEP1
MSPDNSNTVFQLASDFVKNTGRHIFLTGKAGTGKTTFLKHIKNNIRKNTVIVAPTGVAAINAGGVTMHSFFQLPLGPFIPVSHTGFQDSNGGTDKHTLFRNMRINKTKRKIFQELELLIIDEVSMVRADMLDAMDAILRHFRRQQFLPFGGVQVLFIGDMYQLPPVTVEHEWQLLSNYYASPFFFDAHVMQQAPPLYIELKKIYRQSDQVFIDVLNRVRNNNVTPEDLALLNSKYQHGFTPAKDEKYITLCTHNYKAEQINNAELQKLPSKLFTYKGVIEGEFSDKALPAELLLQVKVGAQIMFIKNDKGEERRFYNGKLATVTNVEEEKITVALAGSEELVVLEKETWRNIRYKLNDKQTEIEEEELGTFTQYPIRLAWAITIHKSQGLTFEKAIVDAGQSFAAGQVYVALSRCTSLEGIVLYSRILPQSINTDYRVMEFAQKEQEDDQLQALLASERKVFEADRLKKLFDWHKILLALEEWKDHLPSKKIDKLADTILMAMDMTQTAYKHQEVAGKFQRQVDSLLTTINEPEGMEKLAERMHKAIAHFTKVLHDDIAEPLDLHIKEVSKQTKVKQYILEMTLLQDLVWNKLGDIYHASYVGQQFNTGLPEYTRRAVVAYKPPPKAPVGATRLETLKQFKEGNTIEHIAVHRNLAASTIEGHLAESIGKGELLLTEVMDASRIAAILPVVKKHGFMALAPIKTELGNDFSFGEIRMVAEHVKASGTVVS